MVVVRENRLFAPKVERLPESDGFEPTEYCQESVRVIGEPLCTTFGLLVLPSIFVATRNPGPQMLPYEKLFSGTCKSGGKKEALSCDYTKSSSLSISICTGI